VYHLKQSELALRGVQNTEQRTERYTERHTEQHTEKHAEHDPQHPQHTSYTIHYLQHIEQNIQHLEHSLAHNFCGFEYTERIQHTLSAPQARRAQPPAHPVQTSSTTSTILQHDPPARSSCTILLHDPPAQTSSTHLQHKHIQHFARRYCVGHGGLGFWNFLWQFSRYGPPPSSIFPNLALVFRALAFISLSLSKPCSSVDVALCIGWNKYGKLEHFHTSPRRARLMIIVACSTIAAQTTANVRECTYPVETLLLRS